MSDYVMGDNGRYAQKRRIVGSPSDRKKIQEAMGNFEGDRKPPQTPPQAPENTQPTKPSTETPGKEFLNSDNLQLNKQLDPAKVKGFNKGFNNGEDPGQEPSWFNQRPAPDGQQMQTADQQIVTDHPKKTPLGQPDKQLSPDQLVSVKVKLTKLVSNTKDAAMRNQGISAEQWQNMTAADKLVGAGVNMQDLMGLGISPQILKQLGVDPNVFKPKGNQ